MNYTIIISLLVLGLIMFIVWIVYKLDDKELLSNKYIFHETKGCKIVTWIVYKKWTVYSDFWSYWGKTKEEVIQAANKHYLENQKRYIEELRAEFKKGSKKFLSRESKQT